MKIGFVIHFFDFRNDVRKVISIIHTKHPVVLFVKKNDVDLVRGHIDSNIEIRVIEEESKSFSNTLWKLLFKLFGKLPKSIRNAYLMEIFKISLIKSKTGRLKERLLLELRMKMPRIISYDLFLSKLKYSGKTKIDDIDKFIFFTDISHDVFLARILNKKADTLIYVYSWDHPCKHYRYPKAAKYLTWNEGLKKDLMELQQIPEKNIRIIGASQFAYVEDFLKSEKQANAFGVPYLYFGCALGIEELVEDELKIIRKISKVLSENKSPLKLVVRPYPVLKNWHHYEALKEFPNIILDDGFRSKDLSVGEDLIKDKFNKIKNAEAFIHLGTTLGLEACFTDTPSFIVDFDYLKKNGRGNGFSIWSFIHQYQNEKYPLLDNFPNVLKTEDEINLLLDTSSDKFMEYNRQIAKETKLKSFIQFAEELVQ